MTNFFFDRRGKLSVVRTSLFFMAIGLVFLFGSFAYVAIESEAARSPLDIPRPNNAEEWAIQRSPSRPYQEAFYKVHTTDVDSVVEHYQDLVLQYGGDPCKRLPSNGNFPDYDPEQPGLIPYKWECIFERSNVPGVFQRTQVTIQPGIPDENPALDTEGYTVIRYEQHWQN